MLCSRCGLRVATGSKFCRDCGMPLSWQCGACGHQNAAGARFCSVCGQTSAKEFPEEPGATEAPKAGAKPQVERRRLTVMFVDLVGSTALGTRLDPEDLREVISAHHNCVTNLVSENGGYVARYIGDGILAYFGYPSAHEDEAECAVRSALLAVEAVHRLSTPAGPAGSLSCRVGIATGIAVIGAIVDGDRDSQTAVGETPNFAARLQAVAETDLVVIDEATRRLTGEMFQYRRLGPLDLKGLKGPVTAWAVTKENIIGSRFRALRSIETPLIGRTEEKSLLLRRWEKVLAGQGVMCLLIGEAGVGKSRLISVLEDASQGGDRLPPLQFSCSAHQQDAPLYPIIRHIELAAKIEGGDSHAREVREVGAAAHGIRRYGNRSLPDRRPSFDCHANAKPAARFVGAQEKRHDPGFDRSIAENANVSVCQAGCVRRFALGGSSYVGSDRQAGRRNRSISSDADRQRSLGVSAALDYPPASDSLDPDRVRSAARSFACRCGRWRACPVGRDNR